METSEGFVKYRDWVTLIINRFLISNDVSKVVFDYLNELLYCRACKKVCFEKCVICKQGRHGSNLICGYEILHVCSACRVTCFFCDQDFSQSEQKRCQRCGFCFHSTCKIEKPSKLNWPNDRICENGCEIICKICPGKAYSNEFECYNYCERHRYYRKQSDLIPKQLLKEETKNPVVQFDYKRQAWLMTHELNDLPMCFKSYFLQGFGSYGQFLCKHKLYIRLNDWDDELETFYRKHPFKSEELTYQFALKRKKIQKHVESEGLQYDPVYSSYKRKTLLLELSVKCFEKLRIEYLPHDVLYIEHVYFLKKPLFLFDHDSIYLGRFLFLFDQKPWLQNIAKENGKKMYFLISY